MNKEKKKTTKKSTAKTAKSAKGAKSAKRSGKAKNAKPAEQQQDTHEAVAEHGRKEITRATLRNVRISPRKARLIVNLIKGKQVEVALQNLMFRPKKAADFTLKLLRSAISNAVESASADVDKLWVIGAWVNMGRTMKRYMPRAQGRATPIRKRSSHVTVVLGERV